MIKKKDDFQIQCYHSYISPDTLLNKVITTQNYLPQVVLDFKFTGRIYNECSSIVINYSIAFRGEKLFYVFFSRHLNSLCKKPLTMNTKNIFLCNTVCWTGMGERSHIMNYWEISKIHILTSNPIPTTRYQAYFQNYEDIKSCSI